MRPVALTSLTGSEFYPTFSPDGEQVAFSWNGTKQDNWDVYVTLVGSSDVRRLTSDPGEDARPTWSPDGRQIAFVRQRADDSTIHLVSPLGGAERRLGDFRGADSLDWSPDGQWLAAGNSGQLNFGFLALFPRPGWQGTARHLPGFRRRRRRAATDCLEVESCRFEASLFARRPAPRVRLLRLFRRWA